MVYIVYLVINHLKLRQEVANTGSGGGGGCYPGSAPYGACAAGGAGGSGAVIAVECVAGTKAKSGIYSMGAQYVHATRSAW